MFVPLFIAPIRGSTKIHHLAKAWLYSYNHTYSTGRLPLLCIPKNIVWFCYFFSETTLWADHCYCTSQKHHFLLLLFLRNDHSENILGWEQEFWMTWENYTEKSCIQYNYTLSIWVLCWDQTKWTLAIKQCIQEWWIKVSL
jgi:hypothetical protein